jgi:hypothetical protein
MAQGLIDQTNMQLGQQTNWNLLPEVAGAPNVPDFYGGNLPEMGQLPDPNQVGAQPPPGSPTYEGLAEWGQTPEATLGGIDPSLGDLGPTGQAPTQGQYSPEQTQRSLEFGGLNELDAGGGYQDRFAQAQYARNMSLQGPRMQQEIAALDTKLRNQGLNPGSQAYDTAIQNLRDQQGERMGRMSQDAIMAGAGEQQRQFGRELQQRQQGVGEIGQAGQFANQAAQQAFQQRMGAGGQTYQESLGAGQFADQQRAQRAAEQGQRFGQQTGLAGQQFGQSAQQAGMQNALRGQQYQEMRDLQGMYGDQAQQAYQRQMETANLQDRQRQQLMNEQLAMGGQGFQQQMQAAQYQQGLRQQAIAEEAQRRGMSINEMNALLTGQQVQTPQMPGFMGATQQGQPQNLAAAGMQGQYDIGAGGLAAAPWQALGSIGGGLASSYPW